VSLTALYRYLKDETDTLFFVSRIRSRGRGRRPSVETEMMLTPEWRIGCEKFRVTLSCVSKSNGWPLSWSVVETVTR